MIVRIDASSPVPPYAQIRDQVTTMIRSRVLGPGDRLPAIRHLAKDLGTAANTVARAYRELEADGLVATRGRHGTVVRRPAAVPVRERAQGLAGAAQSYALEARHRGLDLDQALDAVRRAFRRIDEPGPVT